PVSTAVFDRMSAATGGKAYFAKSWRDEKKAFASIRDDVAHLYSFSYYPKPNPNRGWRSIKVQLIGQRLKKYRVRTRNGYRPRPSRYSAGNASASTSESVPNRCNRITRRWDWKPRLQYAINAHSVARVSIIVPAPALPSKPRFRAGLPCATPFRP